MAEIVTERAYHTVDKTGWGDGAWNDEPDKVQWIDEATDLDCLAVRGPGGHWCGYVGLPPGHPCHGLDYDKVRVPVPGADLDWPDAHGGLTFASACSDRDDETTGICHVPLPGRPADVWWLGFDCAHLGDLSPAHRAGPSWSDESYKTLGYVRDVTAKLAHQLATAIPEPPDET